MIPGSFHCNFMLTKKESIEERKGLGLIEPGTVSICTEKDDSERLLTEVPMMRTQI